MRVHRPDEFYARLGRDGLIGFGESYLTGAWDADDVAGFLTVLAGRDRHPGPGLPADAAGPWSPARPEPPAEHRGQQPGQHLAPLRPVQRPLRALPRRDAGLLLALFDTSLVDIPRHRGRHRHPLPGRSADLAEAQVAARSSGCSTRPASPTAPGSSRSAPAGASWRSAPPAGRDRSTRSRSRWSSSRSPSSGSPRPGSPTGSRIELLDYRALARTARRTTRSSRSR